MIVAAVIWVLAFSLLPLWGAILAYVLGGGDVPDYI